MQFGATPCLDEEAQTVEHNVEHQCWVISTSKATHHAKAILIAAGIGAFTPKQLTIPQAKQYVGSGLHYSVDTLDVFRNQRVLIVGGGDSAIDWANMLAPITQQLTLIHRTDRFRAHEQSLQQLKTTKTQIKTFHEIHSIQGAGQIRSATIYDNRSNTNQIINVDHILVNIGFISTLGPIAKWGVELQGNTIKVDHRMMTNQPGIFAAGDVASYPGKIKLISVGFGEAAIAVNHAKKHTDPTAKIFPGHSSEMK